MIRTHLQYRTTPSPLLRHVLLLRARMLLITVHLVSTSHTLFQPEQRRGTYGREEVRTRRQSNVTALDAWSQGPKVSHCIFQIISYTIGGWEGLTKLGIPSRFETLQTWPLFWESFFSIRMQSCRVCINSPMASSTSLMRVSRAGSPVGRPGWVRHANATKSRAPAVRASASVDDVLKNEAPSKTSVPSDLNKYSSRITQPKSQGASQAMLYGTGMTPDDMSKPQVGISSVWWEGNTCNMHLNDLALEVKLGVEDAGLVGFRFNTIGVSDGISMGTDGMSYSLQSRDLIADSIETVMSAQWYDANISLPGCDKNMPGTIMAMARLNRPSLMIYGGTIRAGKSSSGEKLDIVSAFQSYGGFAAGLIEESERADIVKKSCPGPGACGGMYTANTMASAIEAMGMSLPYSSSTPAEDPLKKVECRLAGRYLLELMKRDIKPRDIMTKASFENAIVFVMATGGSTNAVLHLIAMANACGVEVTLDDFQRISDKVPFIADLKPSGKYVMEDLHKVRVWCLV